METKPNTSLALVVWWWLSSQFGSPSHQCRLALLVIPKKSVLFIFVAIVVVLIIIVVVVLVLVVVVLLVLHIVVHRPVVARHTRQLISQLDSKGQSSMSLITKVKKIIYYKYLIYYSKR
ncbi:hypothetical protein Droror1_Dr00011693 [Drosera rotundifolia]